MASVTDLTTGNLCHLCAAMLEQDLQYQRKNRAHGFKSPRKLAQDGCPTCDWLWSSVPWLSRLEIPSAAPAPDGGNILFPWHASIRTAPGEEWSPLYQWIDQIQAFSVNGGTIRSTAVPVPAPPDAAILAPFETNILSISQRPSEDTGASETLHMARQWMRKCMSSHVSCAAYRRPDWAPTRLLKVFSKDDGKIGAILEERDDGNYSSDVEYIALSHRWLGDDESPLLSEENRSQFHDKIEISTLKSSIRDAICATIRLGIYYLWVDTLCVLQDNRDDKMHEIGKMDSVYSNALCTIAAGVGETADEGCFTSRDVNQVITHGVHLRLGEKESQFYLLRPSWDDTNRELDNTGLAGRGWTFQERFLSPRTLHFCAKQVHWECREFEANETHPEGDPAQSNRRWNLNFVGVATPWTQIVESYTARALTVPADRLRAIQGVADFLHWNSIAKGQPDKYLHGLWRSSLPQCLLWGSKHQPRHDRLAKVAPTWSWASTNEEICFVGCDPRENGTTLIDILEILSFSDIQTTDEDREVQTKDDVIRIRGRLCRPTRHQRADLQWYNPRISYDYKDTEQSDSEARNEYLPMYKYESGSSRQPIEDFKGIVVRALGVSSSKVYERVGKYYQYCRVGSGDLSFGEEQDIYLC